MQYLLTLYADEAGCSNLSKSERNREWQLTWRTGSTEGGGA